VIVPVPQDPMCGRFAWLQKTGSRLLVISLLMPLAEPVPDIRSLDLSRAWPTRLDQAGRARGTTSANRQRHGLRSLDARSTSNFWIVPVPGALTPTGMAVVQ